ncbi:MAG: GNAT family N-acetyltransferase [bacterium]|nr:GNAT family N-acetyltransferase [bacterium]
MSAEPPVAVKTLTRYSEMVAVEAIQRQILRRPEPYTPHELLAISRTGGQVLGGFFGDDLVGFAVAVFSSDTVGPYLFGVALGVRRGHRNLGLGRRLKMAQRDYALSLDFTRMGWTIAPLLARTSHFHCTALGAICRAYEANYYDSAEGREGDQLASDRLLASWDLTSERVEARLAGERPKPPEGTWVTRVVVEGNLLGLAETFLDKADTRLLLEIPLDLTTYRASPETLAAWRGGVGRLLESYINSGGYAVTECFTVPAGDGRRSFYLLERRPAP